MSLNKVICIFIVLLLIALYNSSKKPLTGDEAVCAGLTKDPSTLPYVSYSTQQGFDECVSRCMTSVMMQVCPQLPVKSNIFATRPEVKQQMLDGCIDNIKSFVTRNTRCPHLNCEP